MGTVFYIEQRFNPDFGVFEPCSITSTGRGSYIFKRFDGVLIGQNLQSGKEVEEGSKFADDAIMSVEDLVSEWGPESYHREPRLSFWFKEWGLKGDARQAAEQAAKLAAEPLTLAPDVLAASLAASFAAAENEFDDAADEI